MRKDPPLAVCDTAVIKPFKNRPVIFKNQRTSFSIENLIATSASFHSLSRSDISVICSWITTREKLLLVSGNIADCLTPDILRAWVSDSICYIVVRDKSSNQPVGFCTLSQIENEKVPCTHIELCHLLVDPLSIHLMIGRLICEHAKKITMELGFSCLCGRVVPFNKFGIAVAGRAGFKESVAENDWNLPGFKWFEFSLPN